MMIASGQSTSDSNNIWINRNNALKVLAAADSGKVYKEMTVELRRDIDSLIETIRIYQFIVAELKMQDSIQTEVISNYQEQIFVMQSQRRLFEGQLKQADKIIRKLKRKVFWTSAAGLAGIGAMAFLLLTK